VKKLILLLAVTCSFQAKAQDSIDHWATIVNETNTWKYIIPTGAIGGWANNGFNDASWNTGLAGIGYGDADDATVVPNGTVCVYMRATFNVLDTSSIESVIVNIDYDDGFVAYLNGVEIARSNMTGVPPTFNELAAAQHEAVMYTGGTPDAYTIGKSTLSAILVNGINVLAIEAHNQNGGSSDLSSKGFFSVGLDDTTTVYNPTPTWFSAPVQFTSSNLPLVVINTASQTIVDDPRITCSMGIIDNGPGIRNYLTDSYNNYSGNISIEIRGSSSQMFPKKSYSFETQDSFGNPLNAPLLGMPAENDWVLYAPYTDKTFLRDVLAYKLGNEMGQWAPRTRYCEVVINGENAGIYVLIEKIKIDNNRVDIASLNPADTSGDQLTGGYLLKVDRYDTSTDHFTSSFNSIPNNTTIEYVYDDPEDIDLLPVQEQYIRDYIYDFEYAAFQSTFADTSIGYRKFSDINSFVDHFLVNEVSRNVDGYRLSAFLYKDKDSNGGKLKAGPLWDYNIAYGNADYCNGGSTTGYALDFNTDCPGDGWQIPFWWYKMLSDSNFVNIAKCRYNELRTNVLSDQYLEDFIDSVVVVLDEAQERNFTQWPILGTYVWPNNFVGNTFTEEINYLKAWLTLRLDWLDANLPGNCNTASINEIANENSVSVYPNPATDNIFITVNSNNSVKAIRITDITGKNCYESSTLLNSSVDISGINPGVYFVTLIFNNDLQVTKKLVKK